ATTRLHGSGELTFTENKGTLLETMDTKGHVTLDETYAHGRTVHLELGTHQSVYSPANDRLGLILTVDQSNDRFCPAEGGPRVATLTLLPTGGGARDTAFFFGIPTSQTHTVKMFGLPVKVRTEPCKGGHIHGWENGSGRVLVRIRLSSHAG